jgi:hypothetical protein
VTEDGIFAPLARLKAALDDLDSRASEILALHAAIEKELDLALEACLPKAERLWGLGFAQKLSVWFAAQRVDGPEIQIAVNVMKRFNELRNRVAHPGSQADVDAAIRRLTESLPEQAPHRSVADPKLAAAFIMGILNSSRRGSTGLRIGPAEAEN